MKRSERSSKEMQAAVENKEQQEESKKERTKGRVHTVSTCRGNTTTTVSFPQ